MHQIDLKILDSRLRETPPHYSTPGAVGLDPLCLVPSPPQAGPPPPRAGGFFLDAPPQKKEEAVVNHGQRGLSVDSVRLAV